MRNFSRVYDGDDYLEERSEENEYTIARYPEIELWDFHEASLKDYDKHNLETVLMTHWDSQFDDRRALQQRLDSTINVRKRLYESSAVYNCNEYPSNAKKLDTLVKLILTTSKTRKTCIIYFSEIIMFFYTHTNSKCMLILPLQNTTTQVPDKRKELQYRYRRDDNTNTADKLIVTHVENIRGHARMLKSSLVEGRHYLIYPDMIPREIRISEISRI
ncbi:hypothetical protein BDA99DRAFT_77268 [Phascolomyces articulosus]|uniref:Uncharacterized protein n=1 Tax=Phascolomyces articulosus TaxID=60185 RepID=A0AAD5PDK8_9FUNG|nr:hypothetical protein BDA99DRAFT_77268 [Phascolomyces articulosus]